MSRLTLAPAERLIVALDVSDIDLAIRLVRQLAAITVFKIGYSLMFDPTLYALMKELRANNKQIFFDAKLNDIPRTVERGVESAVRRGVDFLTVHSDEAMLAAAMQGKGGSAIKIIAVTALTSFDSVSSRNQFRAGLVNAMITHCDGMTMSPQDLNDPIGQPVRDLVGDMIIATPGVRMAGTAKNDHQRIGTPEQAVGDGADYVIVGRPIVEAADPAHQAELFIHHLGV
jgi:orotidine-5'-phosphate decarboxylase